MYIQAMVQNNFTAFVNENWKKRRQTKNEEDKIEKLTKKKY